MTRIILTLFIFLIIQFGLIDAKLTSFIPASVAAFVVVVIMNYAAQKVAENEGGEDIL